MWLSLKPESILLQINKHLITSNYPGEEMSFIPTQRGNKLDQKENKIV